MKTVIDNNQRKFMVAGKGWNTQQYICNLKDIVKCANEFEKNQPYEVSELWNGKFKKLTVNQVREMLEANQLPSSFFNKVKPIYAGMMSK